MKPYRTILARTGASIMLVLASFLILSGSAKAGDCGFTLSTSDATWTFSAAAGATQSRTLTITNTSGAALSLTVSLPSDAFTVNHTQFTIPAQNDSGQNGTATLTITFKPGLNAIG